MTWTKNYIMLMRDMGYEPFGCMAEGCKHVSRTTFGMVYHHLFGAHT